VGFLKLVCAEFPPATKAVAHTCERSGCGIFKGKFYAVDEKLAISYLVASFLCCYAKPLKHHIAKHMHPEKTDGQSLLNLNNEYLGKNPCRAW